MFAGPAVLDNVRSAIAKPVDAREWRAFATWLLVWTGLANAGFAAMYVIGSPPRYDVIVLFGAVGLFVKGQPYPVKALAFVTMMAYSILSFISGLFNLTVSSLIYSLEFFLKLDYLQSSSYTAGSAIVLALVAAACWVLRRDTGFRDFRLVFLALAATLFVAQLDMLVTMGNRGHYQRVATADAPFTSAVDQSGLVPEEGTPDRNIMIVMVESLGAPAGNPEMRDLLFAEYDDPEVRKRFALSRGETTFYNSTTAGEIRELCGRWGDYYGLVEAADETCLPARLAAQGFETSAYHSFTGAFFDRTAWYPNIGFQRRVFAEDLIAHGSEECGGVFWGACDRNVPRQLARRLKQTDKPQLVYWLTVNTHLPIASRNNLEADHCERLSPRLAAEFPMICRQFAIWQSIDAALVDEITADDFPPTDILLVGDHMPPYVDRRNRSQFAPDRVPWLLLKWRGDGARPDLELAGTQAGTAAKDG